MGDAELVTAFQFIGIEGAAVANADEAIAVFRRVTEGMNGDAGSLSVLILTEETADWIGSLLIDWQISGCYPLIVEIPGIMGYVPGRKTLMESIREAIGLHV